MIKVAIQGIQGSYHHQAAQTYFGEATFELHTLNTFREVVRSLDERQADVALMAIENSIAGTILPNYSLIFNHQLKIVGELYVRINHQLMALPGAVLKDLHEVRSHPMALLQCDDFLDANRHLQLVEWNDTASAAQDIAEKKLTGVAAIASDLAAKTFGLEVVAPNIQSIKNNFTRFIVLGYQDGKMAMDFNKASLRFTLPHETGSLNKALDLMVRYNMDLTKIQSVPVMEKPWEYAFIIDMTFASRIDYEKTKFGLAQLTSELHILGEYMSGI